MSTGTILVIRYEMKFDSCLESALSLAVPKTPRWLVDRGSIENFKDGGGQQCHLLVV